MKDAKSTRTLTWKSAGYAFLLYTSLVLLFTLLGILLAPQGAQIGVTRPEETIPGHLAELAAFGVLLGAGSLVVYGRKGLPLVVLIPALTVVLDIDHLPAYLGYPQTIRPAHSLVFLACALAATAITIKALEIDFAVAAGFMGHLAIDTGLFAPYSPISFQYVDLGPYRPAFALGAVICALSAGVVLRRRQGTGGTGDGSHNG